MRSIGALIVGLSTLFAGASMAQPDTSAFPRPESLEPAIEFWKRVYTEVDTRAGFVHDNRRLDIVYETLQFDDAAGSRQRRRETSRAAEKYRDILQQLSRGDREGLSNEEARVLTLWPPDVSNQELADAAARIRFQLGQADRFRAGLIRSGAWKEHILQVLEQRGLPRELAALPHVESSFDPTAYSHAGAAGLWQFTRSTGLRYMQIDNVIDERRDPFLSTYAAARLLADNYAVIESWPLALTAYNHGLGGMRRAAERLGSKDIGVIVDRYDGRTFGFASRNFYAAFLAAVDIDANPSRYFGALDIAAPAEGSIIEMPAYVTVDSVVAALGVSRSHLRALNPALTEAVWTGDKFVPKGYPLRVAQLSPDAAATRIGTITLAERYAAQRPDVYHRVASGDTLSQIAERYGVSLAALVRINDLRSRNFIRIGQVLTLPIVDTRATPALATTATRPQADSDSEYVVRRGDSIDRISRRLGVSAAALMAANGLDSSSVIFPGQSLQLPNSALAEPSTRPVNVSAGASAAAASLTDPESTVDVLLALDTEEPARAAVTEVATGEYESAAIAGALAIDERNALASEQADLAGDPTDYAIAADGTIEVQALETLGHYADWLGIATQRLRDINRLPFGQTVVVGQRIQLELANVDSAQFESRRLAFHRANQESFFSAYQIDKVVDHVVRPGESLWMLAQRTYNVPVWLLRQYNPDLNLDRVSPGTVVKFPNLRRISQQSSSVGS